MERRYWVGGSSAITSVRAQSNVYKQMCTNSRYLRVIFEWLRLQHAWSVRRFYWFERTHPRWSFFCNFAFDTCSRLARRGSREGVDGLYCLGVRRWGSWGSHLNKIGWSCCINLFDIYAMAYDAFLCTINHGALVAWLSTYFSWILVPLGGSDEGNSVALRVWAFICEHGPAFEEQLADFGWSLFWLLPTPKDFFGILWSKSRRTELTVQFSWGSWGTWCTMTTRIITGPRPRTGDCCCSVRWGSGMRGLANMLRYSRGAPVTICTEIYDGTRGWPHERNFATFWADIVS